MASTSARKRVSYTLDVHFGTPEDKERFVQGLKHVRQLLSQAGNAAEDRNSVSQPTFDPSSDSNTKSFLRNSGMDSFKSLCAEIRTQSEAGM